MTELSEIYICLNGEERGPFDSQKIERMLEDGLVRLKDKAWRTGLPEWTTLELVLRPPAPPPAPVVEEPVSAEPATAKQKAFLSYMSIPFAAGLSKDKAALLVNEAMENPTDPKRLARWPEERLRLHPELYAADVQAKKESRPNAFHERVLAEGAECFHDVSKAHCQVLVGYLDVKFPNWDARDSDATWDYFFPALAEKFPQLVNKAWKGRLQYAQGPKIAAELKQKAPTRQSAVRPRGSLVSAPVVAVLALLLAGGVAWVYVKKHPDSLQKAADSARAAVASATDNGSPAGSSGTPVPKDATGAASDKTPAPRSEGAPKTPSAELAMNTPGTTGTPAPEAPANGAMSGTGMAGSDGMTSGAMAPATEPGSPPTLFTPPPAAPGANNATAPAATPAPTAPAARTMAKIVTPLAVKTAYGVVTIVPGTSLKIISKEGGVVRLNYNNQMISVPVSATDIEP